MANPAVKNMRLLRPSVQSGNTALDLGNHPGMNDALFDEPFRLGRGQRRQKGIVLILNPRDIGQENELFGLEGFGYFPGNQVGVDIICLTS